ncbi:metabolite traffic protein EboE [Singulisphaera sp. PoT]|uniref:metabolite traffic protein EboE n=1 Tax=Singulisphaera sp. PoT TaxID=3411797 RepID=UPI003BF58A21
MSLSSLPLSYCTNVHPGQTVAEVEAGIERYTLAIRERYGLPMAAGLWLARPVTRELLATPDGPRRFAARLSEHGLPCYTLNAFPYGNFHGARVKEQVYLPDWSSPDRQRYTEDCARILAELLPDGIDGSISTVPLGFKAAPKPPDFLDLCHSRLIDLALMLDRLGQEQGKTIRLAIEPEPCCDLETTAEALAFFEGLNAAAEARGPGAAEAVRNHLGLCFDVCHQAVEFEDVAGAIREIDRAGVRINKLHISCAIRLEDPAGNREGREALARYVEPRYLHQTFARRRDGRPASVIDLTREFLDDPGAEFLGADEWRIHFHVPVNVDGLGPLGTTRPALVEAIGAVAGLDYDPHLEVETYTWAVLPGEEAPDIVKGFGEELSATHALLSRE